MMHLYYKVLIDNIEVEEFDSDSETRLVNFIHSARHSCAKRIEIIAGYYDGDGKWHNVKSIDMTKYLWGNNKWCIYITKF